MQLERDLPRPMLYQKFTQEPEVYQEYVQKHGTTLSHLFNYMSPEEMRVKGWPKDAFRDMLARADMITEDINSIESSIAGACHEKAGGEFLLNEHLGRRYRRVLSIPQLEIKAAAAVSDLDPERPYRPATDLEIVEKQRFMPRLRIADIGGGVDTITSKDWRRTLYITPKESEESTQLSEGGGIPVTRVTLDRHLQSLKQYGGGIEYSKDFATDPVRVSALSLWAMRRAKRDEIRIVREAIRLCKARAGTRSDVGTAPDLADLLQWNMQGDSGYQFDLVICRASDARTLVQSWINAQMPAGTNFYPFSPDTRFFNEAFPSIGIINNIMGPTRLGFIDDDATDWDGNAVLAAGDVLLIDSSTLRFKRRSNGYLDEEEYKPSVQMHIQYITDWFDWEVAYESDGEHGVKLYGLA